MSSDRREFLQRFALSGVALGTLPSVLHAASATTAAPDLDAAQSSFDVSWPKKLTGKHKAVYDSPDIAGGLGVLRAGIVASQYMDTFKLPASAISNVIVCRHDGIFLAMNQQFWDTYKVGALKGVRHPWTDEPITKNPAILTAADGLPEKVGNFGLDKQIAKGTVVLACALAFADVVDLVGKTDKIDAAAAEKKATSMLIPGVIMQPSGVFATTLAQESGCVYVRAT